MSNENCFVGQVRPSQILWTYGPGALVDLPNLSVITKKAAVRFYIPKMRAFENTF